MIPFLSNPMFYLNCFSPLENERLDGAVMGAENTLKVELKDHGDLHILEFGKSV